MPPPDMTPADDARRQAGPPQDDVDAVYRYAADQLMAGKSPDRVADDLMDRGLSADDADAVVRQLRAARGQAARDAGKKNMLFGGLWLFGGLAVTIGTMVANPDGRFVLAWGAVLFGGIQFIRGILQTMTTD